jgi:hypothetical protein
MCLENFSLLSRWTPRYLTEGDQLIIFDFEFVGDGFGFVGKDDGGCF